MKTKSSQIIYPSIYVQKSKNNKNKLKKSRKNPEQKIIRKKCKKHKNLTQ